MAAPIQSPAKCEVRSVRRFLNAKGERPAEIHKQIVAVPRAQRFPLVSSPKETISLGKNSTTMMRWKKKSWPGSKGRRQTSMTRGYRSWFQDLINVWTMPATMLKNSYVQAIHWQCRFCRLKMLYMFKTFVSLLSGHTSWKGKEVEKMKIKTKKARKAATTKERRKQRNKQVSNT